MQSRGPIHISHPGSVDASDLSVLQIKVNVEDTETLIPIKSSVTLKAVCVNQAYFQGLHHF